MVVLELTVADGGVSMAAVKRDSRPLRPAVIGDDGSVTEATAEHTPSGMEPVALCTVQLALKWKFPVPLRRGSLTVSMPYNFRQVEEGEDQRRREKSDPSGAPAH